MLGWIVTAVFPERYESADKIGGYTGCLFESHSTKDEWVDFDQGTKVGCMPPACAAPKRVFAMAL